MLSLVFEPIKIGSVTVANRIVRTAHGTALSAPTMQQPGEINDAFIRYHEARARGGVGLSILEVAGVHPTSPSPIAVWDDRIIEQYQRLSEATAPHGMRLFQQLYHGGHHISPNGHGGAAPWSASDIPSPMLGLVPAPMTRGQIDELVEGFASAARRVQLGGLDGVEIHAAHGYLLGQFLSPMTNRRDDDYGGSFENRLRLLREVLAATRAATGPEFPIGVRLSAEEGVPDGMDAYQTSRIAEAITDDIDFLDVSYANYHAGFERIIGAMDEPHGYQLPAARIVSKATTKPTIVTGRFTTLLEAEAVLRDGDADLVSMVRATIADPDIVRKTREGRAHEVRPCIACNQGCLGGYAIWGRVGCAVNVSAGRETEVPSDTPPPSSARRRVVVVGGGPAGMEAGRTAALRGHEVILLEAAGRLGGRVNLARHVASAAEMARIVDWLADELERTGVDVRLGVHATVETVAALDPDRVIIATGASPRRDGLQVARPHHVVTGIDLPHVGVAEDLFDGSLAVGRTALVLDDVGHNEAIACAEFLRSKGVAVTFATRQPALGTRLIDACRDAPARQRLFGKHFEVVPYSELREIRSGEAVITSLATDETRQVRADTVVLVSYPRPRRELATGLARVTHPPEIVLVGDCDTPRDLLWAIHDGHFAARSA